jgi:hypothetical protein
MALLSKGGIRVVHAVCDETCGFALDFMLWCGAAASITQPTFSTRHDYPSAPGLVSVADINGDGIPDIVATPIAGYTITTLLGGGGPLGYNALLDQNGNGKADLVLSLQGGIGVCVGNGDGSFQPAVAGSQC